MMGAGWLPKSRNPTLTASTSVNLFELVAPDLPLKQIAPTGKHNALNYFEFTKDSLSLLLLCGHRTVCYIDTTIFDFQTAPNNVAVTYQNIVFFVCNKA